MNTATLKIWTTGLNDMEIVEARKKYEGFPGAIQLVKKMLDGFGVEYTPNYDWSFYTATVTLDQWVEIKKVCAEQVNKMKGTSADKKRCSVCGESDVQFNTTGADVCNDCA